jgi:hypothetical protein
MPGRQRTSKSLAAATATPDAAAKHMLFCLPGIPCDNDYVTLRFYNGIEINQFKW